MDIFFFTFDEILNHKNIFKLDNCSKFSAVCIKKTNGMIYTISGEIVEEDGSIYSSDIELELEKEEEIKSATDIWRLKWKHYNIINKGLLKYNCKNHLRNLIPKY